MTIKKEHITQAENILIDGKKFDLKERIPFIENLSSCDLLAVPGSGKTTALLAKLYCLEKQLPLKNGSAILVLAHTNSTVNLIESTLREYCPKLFSYPNFIGTIQSFINTFLAKPANIIKYESSLNKINTDYTNQRITKGFNALNDYCALKTTFFLQLYQQYSVISQKMLIEEFSATKIEAKSIVDNLKEQKILIRGALDYHKVKNSTELAKLNIDTKTKTLLSIIHGKARDKVNEKKEEKPLSYKLNFLENKFENYNSSLSFSSTSGQQLLNLYENLFRDGIIRFTDAYSLAEWYIEEYSEIKEHLKNRFKYVFIDEMQDLEKKQISIIDKIFYSDDSTTIMQRIGDVNQAIYNSGKSVKDKCEWETRNESYLTGSYRLTNSVASLVNNFTLDDKEGLFKVKGERVLEKGDIAPHLIIFNSSNKNSLKNKFEELIIKYQNNEMIPTNPNHPFKIIGWNAEWNAEKNDESKLRLSDIFNFKRKEKLKKEDFNNLSQHLQLFDKTKMTMVTIRKSILNALIHILRLENIKYKSNFKGKPIERYYSKRAMLLYIKDYDIENQFKASYEEFKHKLYNWCIDVIKGEYESVFNSLKLFVNNEFKDWFNLKINPATQLFILNFHSEAETIPEPPTLGNLKIDIDTVHSVKGETHCATMYVETSYYNYETQKIKSKKPFFKEKHDCSKKRDKEALKMLYVGFSRPTHLLCFAVLEENVKDDIKKFEEVGWDINYV